jgi:hypothetical protein
VALRRKARTKSSKVSSAPSSTASSSTSSAGKSGSESSKSDGSAAAIAPTRSAGIVAQLSDPKTLRRLLLAAKVVGPVVAAGALKTTTTVRGALDDRRARQLGVPVDDVALYKGPVGPVQARIAGLTKAVNDLRDRRGGDQGVARFVNTTGIRLQELSAAAVATHSMPSATQRSAVRAISADLDQLDAELMTFLVGPPTAAPSTDVRRELTS